MLSKLNTRLLRMLGLAWPILSCQSVSDSFPFLDFVYDMPVPMTNAQSPKAPKPNGEMPRENSHEKVYHGNVSMRTDVFIAGNFAISEVSHLFWCGSIPSINTSVAGCFQQSFYYVCQKHTMSLTL